MHKFILACIFSMFTTLLITPPAAAANGPPINDEVYTSVASIDGRSYTRKQVETAIINASAHRGWQFKRGNNGALIGTLLVRGKHFVAVDVVYDSKAYKITYRDSKNMNYDPATKTIHKRYNSWVENLDNDIKFYLQTR